MYYDYFGLHQPPFRITPDTSLFFPGGNRGAVLEAMIYAIVSGEGIVKVVGEVGSGKTMLCRMLALELPDNVEVVYLANPSLSPDNILHAIAFELKLEIAAGDDRLMVMNKLQHYLLARHAENRQVVVFVEEAQSMPLATLEEIRLLSNLETKQNKLLQIVLFGQPELDHMIASREIRQLKERITYSFNLNPLKQDEIRDYINTRLRACGYRASEPFSRSAIKAIGRYSKGLLRRINILADKAMLAAYAGNMHTVSAKHVHAAARDSEFVGGWQRYKLWFGLTGVLGLVLLAVFILPYEQLLQGNKLPQKMESAVPESPVPGETGRAEESAVLPEKEVITLYQPQDKSHYYDYFSQPQALSSVSANTAQAPDNSDDTGIKADRVGGSAQPSVTSDKPVQAAEPAASLPLQKQLAHVVSTATSGLSAGQADQLLEQITQLPPETILVPGDNACNLCSSFIYRPLKMNENL